MACKISINFQGSAESLLQKAETAIEQAGGTFSGNTKSGQFTVPTPLRKTSGTYMISGQTIDITVTQMPPLVTCSTIEKKLKKYLEG